MAIGRSNTSPRSIPELIGPYAEALFYAAVDPRSRPKAAFRGQCLLVRREPYNFTGGHGSVLRYFTEDVHVAASAERHRMRFGHVRSGKLARARFHVDGVHAGLRRQSFRALDAGPMVLAMTLLTATSAALWLPCALYLWFAGYSPLAFGAVLLPWMWLVGWYRNASLLLAPFMIYATLPTLWLSVFPVLTGKVPEWKGRES